MFILGTPHPVWPAQQGRPLQWSRPQQSSPRPLHHLMHRLTTTWCRRNPSPGTKKQTNKSVKENAKFCSRTQRLGFQREVQPVQLPTTASSRWSTTSHHGRLHLQRRQVLTTYPLRCKSSWYLTKKDSYSHHFCQKVLWQTTFAGWLPLPRLIQRRSWWLWGSQPSTRWPWGHLHFFCCFPFKTVTPWNFIIDKMISKMEIVNKGTFPSLC